MATPKGGREHARPGTEEQIGLSSDVIRRVRQHVGVDEAPLYIERAVLAQLDGSASQSAEHA